MANNLPDKGPATSSAPASSSSPPSSPSSAVDSYIGSFISLTSKYEIRYEGILYHLNPQESTLGLKNVRSYGSEGRRKDGPQIAPGDKVYEYILFRGSDIKDLQVKTVKPSSPGQKQEDIHNDPAIIQSQSLVGMPSSSKPVSISGGPGGSLTESTTHQGNASGNTVHPGTLPSYQSKTPLGFEGSQQAMENSNLAPGNMPMSAPDLNGRPSNIAYPPQLPNSIAPISAPVSLPATYPSQHPNSIAPISAPMSLPATYPSQRPNSLAPISAPMSLPAAYPHQLPNSVAPTSAPMSLPATVQNYSQPSVTPAKTAIGMTYPPNAAPSPSLTASNSLLLNDLATYTPDLHSTLSGMPSSLSGRVSVPSHPALPVANRVSTSPFASSLQDMNAMEAPFVEKRGNDPFSFQSLPFAAPSYSTAGSLLTPQHTFPAPDQFLQHRESLLSNVQKPYPAQRDMLALNSGGPAHFSSPGAIPVNQAPILPSPLPFQQPQPPMPKFTEEFDFEAMNEKFKKEEVWGYLGGAKQGNQAEGSVDNSSGQNSGDGKGDSSTAKPKPQTAYKKDDFFDTLSGSSHGRGVPRNGHNNRFSERPRHNTETFGSNYHGNQPGYGSYGGGRGGDHYWGPNNWGRGYNYNGRGRGAYWDM